MERIRNKQHKATDHMRIMIKKHRASIKIAKNGEPLYNNYNYYS